MPDTNEPIDLNSAILRVTASMSLAHEALQTALAARETEKNAPKAQWSQAQEAIPPDHQVVATKDLLFLLTQVAELEMAEAQDLPHSGHRQAMRKIAFQMRNTAALQSVAQA